MSDAITLHGHVRSGNVYKVALMLALTETPYTFREVDLVAGEQRGDAFRTLNPFAKVPVLEHGDLVIRQSNTILLHLAAHTRRFASRDAGNRTRISEWLFWEPDALLQPIGRRRFLRNTGTEPEVAAWLGTMGEASLDVLDRALAVDPWLAGDEATIADIAVYAYARLAEEAGYDVSEREALRAWRERVESLPGWGAPAELM